MMQETYYCRIRSIFIIILALASIPEAANAQNFFLGAKLGMSNSSAIFEDKQAGERIDPRPGLQFGGMVVYELNSLMALQGELLFVQKGWKEQGTGGGRKLTYLDLPLLLALSAPWKTSPQLLVGPSLGYELSSSVTEVPDVGVVSSSDPRVAWEREKLLFGIWFGLGLRQTIGAGKLGLQLMGNVSLTDINREALPRGYIRPFSITVSAFYQISLGGE